MSGMTPWAKMLGSARDALVRVWTGTETGTPFPGFSGYRVAPVFRRAWCLFGRLSVGQRWQVAGAFGLLMALVFAAEKISWESPWKWLGIWLLQVTVSTWVLALFLLPRDRRVRWRERLPRIALFLFLVDLICRLLAGLIFSGMMVVGILTGWVLSLLPVPPLWGKISPDFLIVVPPLIFLGVTGFYVVRMLLGLVLAIPLMLDRNAGLGPAVRASLASTQHQRGRLFFLFVLMATVLALSLVPISLAKIAILGIPSLFPTLLPASSAGVWVCFALQTMALTAGTVLAIWIWPLGSALWAALYLERWKPGAPDAS